LESLDFWMTISPNVIVEKKCDSKPSEKKRQKAAMNLSLFAASSHAHGGSEGENEAVFRQTSSLGTA
jgi:hypothetical protein